MSVILSPRGNEASNMMKRFVRYEEAAHYFGLDETHLLLHMQKQQEQCISYLKYD